MKTLNPDYVKTVTGMANESPYFRHLGMVISGLGLGEALVELDSRGHHLQIYGNVHGGVIASLADTAIFWSCFAELEETVGITTVDLKVNYLAPVADGKLSARGRRIRLGRTLGLGAAEIVNGDGKLVAHATSSVIVLTRSQLPSPFDSLKMPKFLPWK